LHSNDFNFTAVTLKQAPDGSVVFSDWYDKQKCHSGLSEIWDRSNGRLYRVKYAKGWTPWKPSADVWSAPSTLELQLQENGWLSRVARRRIAEAAAKAPVDPTLVAKARNLMGSDLPAETRLRLMWWLHATSDGANPAAWRERLRDAVRQHDAVALGLRDDESVAVGDADTDARNEGLFDAVTVCDAAGDADPDPDPVRDCDAEPLAVANIMRNISRIRHYKVAWSGPWARA
jgi:hypothetical protein